MKIVILSDEDYAAIGAKLPKLKRPKLPHGRNLHHMARNGETPEAFTVARERMEAAADAADATRAELHRLITDADDLGVKTGALSRWSGYTDRRVHQIVTSARRAARANAS